MAAIRASADDIRASFSEAMSAMYRREVPLYGDLLDIVDTVNAAASAGGRQHPSTWNRLGSERHGAIRLGTAAELGLTRRMFAVMGMSPVGYYDLAPAGLPVHSTAFRPIDADALARSPFRVFTSLLRLDLIADGDLRAEAGRALAGRQIYTPDALALLDQAERDGGLRPADAERFVTAVTQTFRWHGEAMVDAGTYRRLNSAHRLVADIVSFRGPHINHLTPRTLDIDATQAEMIRRGIKVKPAIEGPPRRQVAILLRQTSFQALEEPIWFPGEGERSQGSHTARFGEVEQRGIALTPAGRALYDELLATALAGGTDLATAFRPFPDDLDEIRRQGLGFFTYRMAGSGPAPAMDCGAGPGSLDALIEAGVLVAEPIVYEDFLPVSAAGIFRSNLGGDDPSSTLSSGSRHLFEAAMGAEVLDPMALYYAEEKRSLAAIGLLP